ncbi:MAG TPA: response regulator transcription factor [Candidatus Binatia bacterium]|nr:response regulator transcription factor [Candidatus Binatia bacterium]
MQPSGENRGCHTWEGRVAVGFPKLAPAARAPKTTTPAPAAALPVGLSSREREVLVQVAIGLSNKQVARVLGISENTVRHHLSHVFDKLRAANRTEAVMAALRVGLLT